MVFQVLSYEMIMALGLIFLIMFKFALKMRQDLLEDELLYSFMEKTDKQVLLELLKRANLEWDEWNDYMLTFDGRGYI
jgi:Tfp pilus assembly protein PilO